MTEKDSFTSESLLLQGELPGLGLEALNKALAFAWQHKWRWYSLCIIPLLVEMMLSYVQFSLSPSPQNIFLILFVYLVIRAWLVTVVTMSCLEFLQREELLTWALAKRALQHLPKILVCYMVLTFIVSYSFFMVLILAVFFLWAPVFCVSEIYAHKVDPEEDEVDEDDLGQLPSRFLYFIRKYPWELGLVRSSNFSGRFIGVTFRLALLFWFSAAVPRSFIYLFANEPLSVVPQLLAIPVAYFFEGMALAATASTFYLLIPKSARAEIGLPVDAELPLKREWKLAKRPVVLGILAAVSLAASVHLVTIREKSLQLPTGVNAELTEDRVNDSEFVLVLRLTDERYAFRWLDERKFSLRLLGGAPEILGSNLGPVEGKNTVMSKESIHAPETVDVVDEQGNLIDERMPRASGVPLYLRFTFKVDARKLKDTSYQLRYPARTGQYQVLIEGSLLEANE